MNNRRTRPQHGPPLQQGEEECYMPTANITRIMRQILPDNSKITDDAKQAVTKSVSEFIRLITGEANDRCQSEQRRTVTADDLICSMYNMGFDDYARTLSLYLAKYRRQSTDQEALQVACRDPTLPCKPTTAAPSLHMFVGDDRNFISLGGLYDASSSSSSSSSSSGVLIDYFKDPVLGSGSGQASGSAGAGEDGGAS
ncbi:Nuclear transcription factor Y subunit B-6 [Linum grandiflorum]